MKFALLIFLSSTSISAKEELNLSLTSTKMEIVRDLVDEYQQMSYARYNVGIDLQFDNSDNFNATAGPDLYGNPQITFHAGLLRRLEIDEIVFVACHEIGHILGHNQLVSRSGTSDYDEIHYEPSVEGEADYFAGQCTTKYFEDPYIAINTARTAFNKIYEYFVKYGERYSFNHFQGVNQSYPSPECRLQSVINGALGHERPNCWYNP